MYVDRIRIENFRTYRHSEINLLHPARKAKDLEAEFGIQVIYKNVNLILGINGMGKSTFLKAVGLACLGPTVRDSGIFAYRFVRREPGTANITLAARKRLKVSGKRLTIPSTQSMINAEFVPNPQDDVRKGVTTLTSRIRIDRRADLETLRFIDSPKKNHDWNSIFRDDVDAFFFVGYGAGRRTEEKSNVDASTRRKTGSARARRLRSLFDEDASLVPLSYWLPAFSSRNPGRAKQVVNLIKAITGEDHYTFTGELERDEYLFRKGDQLVPFPALSDGYKAFFGWLGDLLYHVCTTAPRGKKLVENCGIVLIDEVDLHLHPSWQMEVLPRLSKQLPCIQFIVTSHSPLIAGSLQWANLIVLDPGEGQSSTLNRKPIPVHGLDADQVLLTPFFDMQTTRAGSKATHLRSLRDRTRKGDRAAAMQIMDEMSKGSEETTFARGTTKEPTAKRSQRKPSRLRRRTTRRK